MTDPLARPLWRGRTNVDAITAAAIEKAEEIGGHEFVVTQGSYQNSVSASAGTHDGGGAVDLRWCGHVGCILALRKAGFAAWHRNPSQGPWPDHTHAVLIGHPKLAPSAARQVDSYRAGRNGLANNGADDGPRISPIPVFTFQEDDMFSDNDRKTLGDLKASVTSLSKTVDNLVKREATRNERVQTRLKRLIAQGKATREELAEVEALLAQGE